MTESNEPPPGPRGLWKPWAREPWGRREPSKEPEPATAPPRPPMPASDPMTRKVVGYTTTLMYGAMVNTMRGLQLDDQRQRFDRVMALVDDLEPLLDRPTLSILYGSTVEQALSFDGPAGKAEAASPALFEQSLFYLYSACRSQTLGDSVSLNAPAVGAIMAWRAAVRNIEPATLPKIREELAALPLANDDGTWERLIVGTENAAALAVDLGRHEDARNLALVVRDALPEFPPKEPEGDVPMDWGTMLEVDGTVMPPGNLRDFGIE